MNQSGLAQIYYYPVIPAYHGIHSVIPSPLLGERVRVRGYINWIPAFAGMTL